MEIEWDDRKAAINERKHGIRFSVASEVFEDPMRTLALDSSMDYGEERWVSIGFADDRLVLVVYTEVEDTVRLISARLPTRTEARSYYDREI